MTITQTPVNQRLPIQIQNYVINKCNNKRVVSVHSLMVFFLLRSLCYAHAKLFNEEDRKWKLWFVQICMQTTFSHLTNLHVSSGCGLHTFNEQKKNKWKKYIRKMQQRKSFDDKLINDEVQVYETWIEKIKIYNYILLWQIEIEK